jgi:hypothetical protein
MGVPCLHNGVLAVELFSSGAAIAFGTDATNDSAFVNSGPQSMCAALAHGTNPTAVTANDAARWYCNRAGIPFVIGGHPNIQTKTWYVADADGAQTGTAIDTCSTSCKIVVTRASIKCSGDNSVKVDFRLAFDTDSTLIAQATSGVTGEIVAWNDIPAGFGFVEGGGSGILGVGGDDQDLRFSLSDPVSGSCNGSVSYYTIES